MGRAKGWFRARRWWQQIALVMLCIVLAPIPCILLLGVVNPPITMVMLGRVTDRLLSGERPVWPAHDPVSRAEFSPICAAPCWRRKTIGSICIAASTSWSSKALERRRQGGRLRGASTLTQQVVKNVFLWNGRSFIRKGFEAYLALCMDFLLSKERILDLYLNLAEWGPNAFGAEAGARYQFGKSARNLTREEAARMAAILPAPRRWPAKGRVASQRVGTILARMQYPAPKVAPEVTSRSPAPVDAQHRPVDEAGLLGDEKAVGIGHIVRSAQARERRGVFHGLQHSGRDGLGHGRSDEPRCNGVHGDTASPQFPAQTLVMPMTPAFAAT